ncbi:MAG: nitronate monooxygenase, partial [Chloroflexota bacterium]|nr:nitronate monooxygenase [Chloroflexota bacterium]
AATEVRARTQRPFGINLFAPLPEINSRGELERMLDVLGPVHAALEIPAPAAPKRDQTPFAEQLEAVLDSGASVFSFTFNVLPPETIGHVKERGMLVVGTATTVDEAVALEAAGVDAVVAQGSEAGAHRGTFATSFDTGLIGTMALVPQVVDAVRIPVIAAGGIMDGRGVAAALALGAEAAQLGTAFLTCHEAGVPDSHKQAIVDSHEDSTRVTRAFSGRPARGIVNRLMDAIDSDADAILDFPAQNLLTRPARAAAAQRDDPAYLSLWAGQGLRMARRLSAAQLVTAIVDEIDAALRTISRS